MSSKKKTDSASGRDASGRFAEGNPGAPHANPFRRRLAELRQAMIAAVSAEDVQDIIRQVVVKARLGDLTAAKLALSYVVGKATAAVEPDRVDLDEWKLRSERPTAAAVNELSMKGCPPQVASAVLFGMDALAIKEAMKMTPAPCTGGLTGAARANGKPSGGRKSPEGKRPVESTDVSIVSNGNGHAEAASNGRHHGGAGDRRHGV